MARRGSSQGQVSSRQASESIAVSSRHRVLLTFGDSNLQAGVEQKATLVSVTEPQKTVRARPLEITAAAR